MGDFFRWAGTRLGIGGKDRHDILALGDLSWKVTLKGKWGPGNEWLVEPLAIFSGENDWKVLKGALANWAQGKHHGKIMHMSHPI